MPKSNGNQNTAFSKRRSARLYYNFNPELSEPFNVIHPLQLKKVRKLLQQPIPALVDYIFLFGGSLDLSCDLASDLDLYVVTEADHEQAYEAMYNLVRPLRLRADILVSAKEDYIENAAIPATVEGRMRDRGVCIYEKAQGNAT